MSPPRDWLALRSDEGCKSRYPSRRPNTEKTYARENIMVAPPSPYSSRAKAFIWSRVMAPVMRAQSDSSRLPQRRPMVACLRAQQARVPQPLGHALVNHLQAVHTAVNTRERRSWDKNKALWPHSAG